LGSNRSVVVLHYLSSIPDLKNSWITAHTNGPISAHQPLEKLLLKAFGSADLILGLEKMAYLISLSENGSISYSCCLTEKVGPS